MDIAALSVVASNYKLQESASVMIMKKAMDTAREGGNDLVEMMMEAGVPESTSPYLGNNVDQYV